VYLHEEIERESEGLELGNEVSDGAERAKIERHDDEPRPSHGQDPSRLRPDPRRSAW